MANQKVRLKNGSNNIYPMSAEYCTGDTIAIASTSPVFVGFFRSTSGVRFLIPINGKIRANSATVTGTFLLRGETLAGTQYTIGTDVTAECSITASGITVNLTFPSAISGAASMMVVAVQSGGMTITLT